jgi:hypothetical protein
MHQPRVGYNDRARGSSAGGKKKGKRLSRLSASTSEQADPNATIHAPKTPEEKEIEKKERIKQEVCYFREIIIDVTISTQSRGLDSIASCSIGLEDEQQEKEETREIHC